MKKATTGSDLEVNNNMMPLFLDKYYLLLAPSFAMSLAPPSTFTLTTGVSSRCIAKIIVSGIIHDDSLDFVSTAAHFK